MTEGRLSMNKKWVYIATLTRTTINMAKALYVDLALERLVHGLLEVPRHYQINECSRVVDSKHIFTIGKPRYD
jgi:hypothetical protein